MKHIETLSAEEIITKLQNLEKSQGWKVLKEIIELNDLESLREKLLTGEYKTIEERNRDKDKFEIFRNLFDYPENYVTLLSDQESDINADPYFTSQEEIAKAKKS